MTDNNRDRTNWGANEAPPPTLRAQRPSADPHLQQQQQPNQQRQPAADYMRSPMAAQRANQSASRKESGVLLERALIIVPLLFVVFGLGILAALFGLRILGDDGEETNVAVGQTEALPADESQQTKSTIAADGSVSAPATDAETSSTDPEQAAADLVVPAPDPTKMVLELKDFQFYVSGVVPDQASADAITQATQEAYGQFGTANIVVDPAQPRQPWLDSAPQIVKGLWTLLDGKLEVTDTDTIITARSPNENFINTFLGFVEPADGFPPVTNNIELVELGPPRLDATRGPDGIVVLSGQQPSRRLTDEIVRGVEEAYGAENVRDEIEVVDGVFARFGLIRFSGNIAAYEPFGEFSTGVLKGEAYGTFKNGLNFETGSAEITPALEAKLEGFPAIFAKSNWPITITGHTDDQGSAEANLRLSEARAKALGQFFVSKGLAQDRVIIVAKGQEEPVATNETAEGRAENRRVLFNWGVVKDD